LSFATWLKQAPADTASIDGTHMKENILNISARLVLDGFVPFYGFRWLASVKSTHIFFFLRHSSYSDFTHSFKNVESRFHCNVPIDHLLTD